MLTWNLTDKCYSGQITPSSCPSYSQSVMESIGNIFVAFGCDVLVQIMKFLLLLQEFLSCRKMQNYTLTFKPKGMCEVAQPQILCAMNMTAGQSDESGKLNFDHVIDKAKQLWDNSPQPVKSFPWNRALDNFIQLILDIVVAVIKYLSIPVFAISCISEMSYCAHERKLYFTPFPFLVGAAVAGVLRTAALESSPSLKVILLDAAS